MTRKPAKLGPQIQYTLLKDRPRLFLLELLLLIDVFVTLVTLTIVETNFFALALREEDFDDEG